jgi:cytochrome c-type biogenesis protein CcmF
VLQPTYEGVIATIEVSHRGRRLTTLYPEKRLYFVQNQPTTEVALRTSLFDDLYIILAGFEPSGVATLKVFVNPLVLWLWIGGLVIVMGTIIALWPARAAARTGERRAPVPVGTVSAPEESF